MAPGRSRQELQIEWGRRVTHARDRYKQHAAICTDLIAERLLDFRNQHSPNPDGTLAFIQALRKESEALKEYTRVTRIYNDLLLHGTVPDEDPDSA